MSTLTCIEIHLDKEKNYFGSFLIEPLETGQGITLGNALRRTLLSDLSGFSITGIRINDLKHEFSTIEGVREDVLEIILNIKEIVLKGSIDQPILGRLKVDGPKIITAGLIEISQVYKFSNSFSYFSS
jgi:DNA-directed RNA polymerase subunit alpha